MQSCWDLNTDPALILHPASTQALRREVEQDDGWLWSRGGPFCSWADLQLWGGRVSPWHWLPGGWEFIKTLHRIYMWHEPLKTYILSSMCFLQGLTVQSSQAVSNAKRLGWPLTEVGEALYLTQAPGGYHFYLLDKEQPPNGEWCYDNIQK